ncbi:MAG: sugar ABC transporter substrate-binding protein [Actinobacteria bacterium]|nr:sugar ABC transporter substrate-binding protein [Actinomycetota bacterium]
MRFLIFGLWMAVLLAACGSTNAGVTPSSSKALPPRTTPKISSAPDTTPGDLTGIPAGSALAKPTVNGSTIDIPLGNGKSISWRKGTPLRIAFFAIGSNNAWLVAQIKAVQAQAARVGATVTVYDGNFDATTQQSQVETALTSGRYNAFIVNPVDPQLECDLFTVQAPAHNIPVVDLTGPLCSRNGNNGSAAWSPGTVAFVGGHDLERFFQNYFTKIAQDNPHATVGFLAGPHLNGPTTNAITAMKRVEAQYRGFDVVATYRTNYTSAQGLTDTEALLQAHPNVKVIVSTYSGQTYGALAALNSLGKAGKVKVYTIGGNREDITSIESGTVEMSVPLYPASMGITGVNVLYRVTRGEAAPRYLGNDGRPVSSLQKPGETELFLTKSNIAKYHPQY